MVEVAQATYGTHTVYPFKMGLERVAVSIMNDHASKKIKYLIVLYEE